MSKRESEYSHSSSCHEALSTVVGAHGVVGAGTYGIGQRNSIPTDSPAKNSGTATASEPSALRAFFK